MRPLSELINTDDPAWPEVQHWIAEATNHVEVLPVNEAARDAALLAIQVTTRSPMGAIVYETGGILIDHGWLRILGSGHSRLPRSLASWNEGRTMFGDGQQPGYLLVADDVLGGFFAINGGALGEEMGSVFYFSPDTADWECLDYSYSEFIFWCLQGNVAGFYESMRWPGWEQEVSTVGGDQGIFIMPFLFTKGPPIAERHRGVVPISQIYTLHFSGNG
ncbi:MAG TPA: DUF2625 domain-containing protein [Pyrinomonadaceae bacterium]|nr:DUF2625 domain-containing protein [Pyrinomonadaceae bacterium]